MKKQLCVAICFSLCINAAFAQTSLANMQKKVFDAVAWKIRPAGNPLKVLNDSDKTEIIQVIMNQGSGFATVVRDGQEDENVAQLDGESRRSAIFMIEPHAALEIQADLSLRVNTVGTYQIALVD